jgi:hypothetical protein
MVNRSRLQSQEQPSRLSWLMMVPPLSVRHSQTRSMKGVAAQVVTAFALLGQLPLHHVLGGDAGMVGAGQPQGVVAAHPVIAGQDILQGVVQGMAHMQDAGDVGRRDDDGKSIPAFLHLRLEAVLLLPGLQPLLFDIAEVVALR